MGLVAFDVTLNVNMPKDAIVDNQLPVQSFKLAAQANHHMTPGQVTAMTPYNTNSPQAAWQDSGLFKS
jgi:hypothetical protein